MLIEMLSNKISNKVSFSNENNRVRLSKILIILERLHYSNE